jgi:hypothetical protein
MRRRANEWHTDHRRAECADPGGLSASFFCRPEEKVILKADTVM